MPTISDFDGIQIMMFQLMGEHTPPHIHAKYSGEEAAFSIETGEMLYGGIPYKQAKKVSQFIEDEKDILLDMWRRDVKYYIPYDCKRRK